MNYYLKENMPNDANRKFVNSCVVRLLDDAEVLKFKNREEFERYCRIFGIDTSKYLYNDFNQLFIRTHNEIPDMWDYHIYTADNFVRDIQDNIVGLHSLENYYMDLLDQLKEVEEKNENGR